MNPSDAKWKNVAHPNVAHPVDKMATSALVVASSI